MKTKNQPPAAGEAAHAPTLIEFVAEIDRLIDAQKPSTHLWNYCVWNRKAVLRDAVRHQMSVLKVLAHHELMPGRVADNTEALLADLTACNENAGLSALTDANVIARCDAQDRTDKLTEQNAALVEALEVARKALEANGWAHDVPNAMREIRAALQSAKPTA